MIRECDPTMQYAAVATHCGGKVVFSTHTEAVHFAARLFAMLCAEVES